jgi:hypothetical protein
VRGAPDDRRAASPARTGVLRNADTCHAVDRSQRGLRPGFAESRVSSADRPAIEGGTPVAPRTIPIAAPRVSPRAIRQVVRLLRSGHLRDGALARQFERRFATIAGARHGVAVSSGTAALHLAYTVVLSPGDEVIVPAPRRSCSPAACRCWPTSIPKPIPSIRRRPRRR